MCFHVYVYKSAEVKTQKSTRFVYVRKYTNLGRKFNFPVYLASNFSEEISERYSDGNAGTGIVELAVELQLIISCTLHSSH